MMSARYTYALCVLMLAGCGARTGLRMEESDASVDVTISFDAPMDTTIEDAGVDVFDAAEDIPADIPPDIFVPICPDSVRVAGREASIPVDTIWALDTSFSMADDLERMRENIGVYWSALSGANIDSRTIFVAQEGYAPPPPAGFSGRFVSVNEPVGSWDALSKLISTFDIYGRRLRRDAITHFVVVTDDDSRALEWEEFRNTMEGYLGHPFIFHAVASEEVTPTPNNPFGVCTHSSGSAWRAGIEYYEMAEATGGLQMSICNDDWSELFDQLNERVAIRVPLPCAYSLPNPAPVGVIYDPDEMTVLAGVPGEANPRVVPYVGSEAGCTGQGGWWYVDDAARVTLCEATCGDLEALDARIEVDLGCGPS